MARPHTDRRQTGRHQSCMRPEAWPSGNMDHQPCQRHCSPATQDGVVSARQPSSPSSVSHPSALFHQHPQFIENAGADTHSGLPSPDPMPQMPSPVEDPLQNSTQDQNNQQLEDQAMERVAIQLRKIGDELNDLFLQRRNGGPQMLDWRGLCRGLLTFVTDTLNAIYR
uniref:Uncharacterized protein n=1 Tax=Denticeps clupeoides TaxID=299321 RepID=A0AAY4EDF9_9TELE